MSYQWVDVDGVIHDVVWRTGKTKCDQFARGNAETTEEPATCLGCIGYVDTHRRTISASQLPNMQQIPKRPR